MFIRDVTWNPSIIIVRKLPRTKTKDATENLIAVLTMGWMDGWMDVWMYGWNNFF
jgi:hypothetical protein